MVSLRNLFAAQASGTVKHDPGARGQCTSETVRSNPQPQYPLLSLTQRDFSRVSTDVDAFGLKAQDRICDDNNSPMN